MQRCIETKKANKGISKQGKYIIVRSRERVCIKQTGITEMNLTNGYTQTKPHGGWMYPHKIKPTEGVKHDKA